MVGKYAWVPFIFGDIGYVTGGWLSGKLMDRGWSLPRARKLVILLGALCMPAAILAPMAPSVRLAFVAICFMTLGHSLWISNLLTLPTDLFKANEVGTATGLTGMGGAIGGVLATLGTGYLVSRFSYGTRILDGRPDAPALLLPGVPAAPRPRVRDGGAIGPGNPERFRRDVRKHHSHCGDGHRAAFAATKRRFQRSTKSLPLAMIAAVSSPGDSARFNESRENGAQPRPLKSPEPARSTGWK